MAIGIILAKMVLNQSHVLHNTVLPILNNAARNTSLPRTSAVGMKRAHLTPGPTRTRGASTVRPSSPAASPAAPANDGSRPSSERPAWVAGAQRAPHQRARPGGSQLGSWRAANSPAHPRVPPGPPACPNTAGTLFPAVRKAEGREGGIWEASLPFAKKAGLARSSRSQVARSGRDGRRAVASA